jgi:hypothetical protein
MADPALPAVQYTRVDPIPHRDLRRTGQPTPDGWECMAQHGTGWKAAKQAGVSYKTVQRLREVDPTFAQDEHDAIWEHVGALEQNLNRIAAGDDMPAVTSNIVRLKRLDPGYIEKNMSISATFSAELPVEDGRTLLHAMLGQPGPALPERSDTP